MGNWVGKEIAKGNVMNKLDRPVQGDLTLIVTSDRHVRWTSP
jgi:hypothetical protein